MQDHDSSNERPVLERTIAIVRRNWLLLLICVVVVPVVALLYSLAQTPQYTATASLVFQGQGLESQLFGLTPVTNPDPQREAATNLQLVSVEQVAARTAKALDKPGLTTEDVRGAVTVSPAGESELASVEATAEGPAFAARLANEVARQYISFSKEINQEKIVHAQALVETKLEELTPAERASTSGQDLEAKVRQLAALAAVQSGNAELAQRATPPSEPSSPKKTRNVALGILLGVMLGIGLALLREQFDRRLRDAESIEEVFDVPVLGTIPQSRAISNTGPGGELIPTGMEGEAFRMLRANLRYFNVDRQITSILITSAAAEDGKTTVAWNVAAAEARAEKRVLFLEADLRRPRLAEHLGVDQDTGLSLVLAGVESSAAAIKNVQGVDLMAAGPLPPNPGELIESQRMTELLAWAEGEYDRVIVDTPPAAVVADAVSLFSQVDGVVIVSRLNKSPREAAEHLRDQLANTAAPLLGIVINGVASPADSGYYRSQPMANSFPDSPNGSAKAKKSPAKPLKRAARRAQRAASAGKPPRSS